MDSIVEKGDECFDKCDNFFDLNYCFEDARGEEVNLYRRYLSSFGGVA